MTERNALTELAEDLEEIVKDTKSDFYSTRIRKAQRIIAEMAKVDALYRFVITKDDYQRYRHEVDGLISKCSAIAEECKVKA